MPDLTLEEIDDLIAPLVVEILETLFDPASGERITRQRVAQALAEIAIQAVWAAAEQQQGQPQRAQHRPDSSPALPTEPLPYQIQRTRIAGILSE